MKLKLYFAVAIATFLPFSFSQDEETLVKKPVPAPTAGRPWWEFISDQIPDTFEVPAAVVEAPKIDIKEIDEATNVNLGNIREASLREDSKDAISVAKGLHNNVTANAVSKTGQDAIALANNGSSAGAFALTLNGGGVAMAGSTTYGDFGAKSAAFSKGNGTATAAAESKGTGSAKSDALAKENNATAATEAKEGGGVANAIAHETGHSLSKASTTDGGSGKAISVATGTGTATAGSHTVGGGNATSFSKSKDGDALGESLSRDGGAAYSASWGKELGNSSTKAVTYGGGGSKAEALADGEGYAQAEAYQLPNE